MHSLDLSVKSIGGTRSFRTPPPCHYKFDWWGFIFSKKEGLCSKPPDVEEGGGGGGGGRFDSHVVFLSPASSSLLFFFFFLENVARSTGQTFRPRGPHPSLRGSFSPGATLRLETPPWLTSVWEDGGGGGGGGRHLAFCGPPFVIVRRRRRILREEKELAFASVDSPQMERLTSSIDGGCCPA